MVRNDFWCIIKHPLTGSLPVIFKPLTPDTAELYRLHRQKLDQTSHFFTKIPDSQFAQFDWYSAKYSPDPSQYFYSVSIGGITAAFLSVYNIKDGSAEVGRFLSTPMIGGKGIFTYCLGALILYFQKYYAIDRFYLFALPSNVKAMSVYERVGFAEISHSHDNTVRMDLTNVTTEISQGVEMPSLEQFYAELRA